MGVEKQTSKSLYKYKRLVLYIQADGPKTKYMRRRKRRLEKYLLKKKIRIAFGTEKAVLLHISKSRRSSRGEGYLLQEAGL